MNDASDLVAIHREFAELRRKLSALEASIIRPVKMTAVDLTAQGAAIGSTTLYAVPANQGGMYRVNWYAKVTRAATTNSTLGALTIDYTDFTDSTGPSETAMGQVPAGTASSTAVGNSLTTVLTSHPLIIWAKSSTNITYTMGYASTGATSMQYELHIRLEFLG